MSSVPAAAESGVVVLDPLPVVAHPSGADERAASIWVVDRGDSTSLPLRTADFFGGVPGAHVDQPGGPGGRATLYLRGAEENYTLVFLDGIPLNDPTNSRGGAVDLSILDPALLRTAAIVRGPASVRYGPETLAGVVHFEPDWKNGAGARASIEGGDDHFRRGAFSWRRTETDEPAMQLGAAFTGDGSPDDGSRARRSLLRGALAWTSPVEARVSAWHLDHTADSFPDDSGGARFATRRTLDHRNDSATGVGAQLGSAFSSGRWALDADVAQFDATITSPGVEPGARDPFGVPASDDTTRLRRYRARFLSETTVRGWTLTGGADAQREDGSDRGALHFGAFDVPTDFNMSRSRLGAFAEASGDLSPHAHFVAGARLDRFDDAGTHGTLRAGVLVPLDAATQWRVNAGTAFKPPSFYAVANPLVGNAALHPERGRSLDTGLRRTFGGERGLFDLVVFTSEFRDGIDFDPGPPPRLVNRAHIRSHGAEAALAWRPDDALLLGVALTYDDARSEPDHTRLRARPRLRAGVSMTWKPRQNFSLTGSLTNVGDVPDTSVPTGDVMLASWARLDLSAAWMVHDHLSLTAAVDNALDERYEEAIGFPSPRRRLRAGLRTEF
jgi:outer membrane cobalamin receptor